ncbi:MAG: hypothetical protein KBC64_06490 [Simkaniaceae bacterium]|nr:hypothetical protein [Simkaniaceae bacterium]
MGPVAPSHYFHTATTFPPREEVLPVPAERSRRRRNPLVALLFLLKKKAPKEKILEQFEALSLEDRTYLCHGVYAAHAPGSSDPSYGEREIYRDPTILLTTFYKGKNLIASRLPSKTKKHKLGQRVTHLASFGCHSTTTSPRNRDWPINFFLNTSRGALVLSVITTIALVAIGHVGVLYLGLAIAWNVGSLISCTIFHVVEKKHIAETAGIIINKNELKKLQLIPEAGVCGALPTQHSADTELWRKRLIEAAEENIVISGNYCGGEAFIDFLKLIKKRLQERPHLKVVILSSPTLLKGESRDMMDKMIVDFPQNISLVESPSIWHISPGVKLSTNHTKGMVIDYGRYFILGGSGIKDNFVQTGLDDVSKEDFLEGEGEPPQRIRSETAQEGGVLEFILPTNFRDQDFVFSSHKKNLVGGQLYKQMLLLAHRWERYNQAIGNVFSAQTPCEEVKEWGLFTGQDTPLKEDDTLTDQLLKTAPRQVNSRVAAFEESVKKTEKVVCKIISSAPEHSESSFAKELIKEIKKARKSISINHMYFHPSPEVMAALTAAVKRGVKVELITNGVYPTAPFSHRIFGPRSKHNYSYLMNSLSAKERERVSIYEFRGFKKGNHKKLVVIDEKVVIAGSSNLGYKSLVTSSDYEINFIAKSSQFALETLKIHAIDREHSQKVERGAHKKWSLSLSERYRSLYYRCVSPLIG